MLHLAACQFDIAWEDKPANFARVRAMVAAANLPAGTILFLPEMFATGFSMNVDGIADDGATERFLRDLAIDHGICAIGGLVGRHASGKGLNQLVGFDATGQCIIRYTKMHPFSFGDENRHYVPGPQPAHVDLDGARICPFICYDLRFPEIFRHQARRGAHVFGVIANWPAARQDHWTTLLRARAIENQACVVGVNRIGRDPNASYCGGSIIVDPQGVVVADAGDAQRIIAAPADMDGLRQWRRQFGALADMRELFVR